MTATDVHIIAKALPKEEYVRLFEIMRENIKVPVKTKCTRKKIIISDYEARNYLLTNVFKVK